MSKKTGSITKHKEELSSLENTDPEFFQFLKENDSELLNFGKDEIDAIDDNAEELIENTGKELTDITQVMLDAAVAKASTGSITGLKTLLAIFRAACIPIGDNDDEKKGGFIITSPDVYESTMTKTLETVNISLCKILGIVDVDITKSVCEDIGNHSKWKKVEVLVLSFFKSILHTLASLVDNHSTQQVQVITYLINSLEKYIPFLSPMHRLTGTVLKVLVGIWSVHDTNSSNNDDEPAVKGKGKKRAIEAEKPMSNAAASINVRSFAFLRIRQMTLLLPGTATEECFRTMYLAFTRHCKSYNDMTSSSINFMVACLVELYKADLVLAYQLAFLYIRQLGLYLRNAVNKMTSESIKQLISWQYINCLRFWTHALSAYPLTNEDGLGELAYPLIQIMLGVIAIAPSQVNIPCKLHLLGFIQQIAANCKVFVPLAPKLVEILELSELFTKPQASTEIPPKFTSILKLNNDAINKATVRDVLVMEVIKLLQFEVEVYRYNPGFPEYFYITTRKLRTFLKTCKIAKWRDLAKSLVNHIDEVVAEGKSFRLELHQSPLQLCSSNAFEPLLAVANSHSKAGIILPVHQRLKRLMFGGVKTSITDILRLTAPSAPFPSSQESTDTEGVVVKKRKNKKRKKVRMVDTSNATEEGDDEIVGNVDWSDDEN